MAAGSNCGFTSARNSRRWPNAFTMAGSHGSAEAANTSAALAEHPPSILADVNARVANDLEHELHKIQAYPDSSRMMKHS